MSIPDERDVRMGEVRELCPEQAMRREREAMRRGSRCTRAERNQAGCERRCRHPTSEDVRAESDRSDGSDGGDGSEASDEIQRNELNGSNRRKPQRMDAW